MCLRQVQQLKSANGLWSDWQLGIWEFILIPVSSADVEQHCSQASSASGGLNNGSVPTTTVSCELVTRQELSLANRLPKSASAGHIANDTTTLRSITSITEQTNNISVMDYFSKYDSSLEKIKENVHRMEQTMK